MAFDLTLTREIVLPLAQGAYTVTSGAPAQLPDGFAQTALLEVDGTTARAFAACDPATVHPAVRAMLTDSSIFGLIGRNAATRTAFVAVRGSQHLDDWLHNLDVHDVDYAPLPGYGQVHQGFQAVYELIRPSLAAHIADAGHGCDRLVVTGHSLGAAVALLAAPDLFHTLTPTLEPEVITFAGPRVGLPNFVASFNADIAACYRVVNFLDIVPHVPPAPYVHAGASIDVDSGGPLTQRHNLTAYATGLAKLAGPQPSPASLS